MTPCACATEDSQPFSHFSPSRGDSSDTPSPLRGRIMVGVRYFLSLRTLIYQGAAISTGQLANRLTKLIGGLNLLVFYNLIHKKEGFSQPFVELI